MKRMKRKGEKKKKKAHQHSHKQQMALQRETYREFRGNIEYT